MMHGLTNLKKYVIDNDNYVPVDVSDPNSRNVV